MAASHIAVDVRVTFPWWARVYIRLVWYRTFVFALFGVKPDLDALRERMVDRIIAGTKFDCV